MKIINKKGLTLVELIITIALIGLIAVVFMPVFLLSAKTNKQSEDKLSATYFGKDAMEMVYQISEDTEFIQDKLNVAFSTNDYTYNPTTKIYKKDNSDSSYTTVELLKKENIINVMVKVYENKTTNKLEVQYETLYFWKGLGN